MDARLKRQLIYGLLLLFVLGLVRNGNARSVLHAAAAANFAPALEVISKRFTGETGIAVQLTISSSGRLFAQMRQRAPFDLYFSADTEWPEMLHALGFCDEPVRYATGKTVLWSRKTDLCALKEWTDVVSSEAVKKIAMANPQTAPYGKTANDICARLENWPEIEKKLVYGSNVGQAFQYAAAGVVDASFIALSLARTDKAAGGCFWEIQGSAPVEQKACIAGYSSHKRAAAALLEYITSDQSADVRERFGYQ